MADYTVKPIDEVPDVLGDYPGEMRMAADHIGSEQVAFTWRRMPAQTGGKGSYGHHHRTQEEVYFVAAGTLQFKCGDDVFDASAGTLVNVPPQTVRSVWNEGPEDAVLVIVSTKLDSTLGDTVAVPDFWPV